jgi:hypothetical protein
MCGQQLIHVREKRQQLRGGCLQSRGVASLVRPDHALPQLGPELAQHLQQTLVMHRK